MEEINDNDFDALIKRKVQELDNILTVDMSRQDLLWEDLISVKEKDGRPKKQLVWQVAASVLLFIASGIVLYHEIGKQDPSEKYENSIQKDFLKTPSTQAEAHAVEYINKICRENNIICQSSDFQELKTELGETSKKLDEISR